MEEQLSPHAHAPTLLSPCTRAGKAVTEARVQRPPQEGKPQGEAPGTAAEGSSRAPQLDRAVSQQQSPSATKKQNK